MANWFTSLFGGKKTAPQSANEELKIETMPTVEPSAPEAPVEAAPEAPADLNVGPDLKID